MSAIKYTDPALVTGSKITDAPAHRSATGYGGKIPTQYMLRYDGIWRRVYMMQYGNSGTPYIRKAGEDLVLDIDTRYDLEALRNAPTTTEEGQS